MTLDLSKLLLFGIVCASLHWLLARAEITKPLWSHAKGPLDRLLRCAGCSGWWLGGLVYAIGLQPFPRTGSWCVIVGGLLGAFVTPVFEGLLLWGLERTAVQDDDPGDAHETFIGLDHEAAHGLAHEIADEWFGRDAHESEVDRLTVVLMHVMGPPPLDEDDDVTPVERPS